MTRTKPSRHKSPPKIFFEGGGAFGGCCGASIHPASVSIHLHTVIVWSYTHKISSSQRGKFNGCQSESSLQLDTGFDFSSIEDIRISQAFFDIHPNMLECGDFETSFRHVGKLMNGIGLATLAALAFHHTFLL